MIPGSESCPTGLGAPEWGRVTGHRDTGLEVQLEESGKSGMVRANLIHNDPNKCQKEYWPEPGERVRVACLGVWPDGELRMTMREFFIGMLEGPHFQHLSPHGSTNSVGALAAESQGEPMHCHSRSAPLGRLSEHPSRIACYQS